MREIVAAMINGKTITNAPSSIADAIKDDLPVQFLERQHMEFMSACDLGAQWDNLAKGRTLFWMDENGKPYKEPPK